MRSPILGVAFGDSPALLREFVLRSTRMTHTDPKAYYGALAAAAAAHLSAEGKAVTPEVFLHHVKELLNDTRAGEFPGLIERACSSADRNEPISAFAASIGSRCGISGYMYHTVPCVIQVWLRHQRDFMGGIREIISAGGDTDTTAAILGGIIGAGVGETGIPQQWLSRIVEWPGSITWMKKLATAAGKAVDGDQDAIAPWFFIPGIMLRNILFLLVVLAHGVRRMFPPYA
jgi:ADP-ribosylglycohydrolase